MSFNTVIDLINKLTRILTRIWNSLSNKRKESENIKTKFHS